MKIEIHIDGEKKIFTAPYVPMLAKRKYLELQAKDEPTTITEQLADDDEHASILVDVVFNNQFTIEQLYAGAEDNYFREKLFEAVFGKPKQSDEGNEQGK